MELKNYLWCACATSQSINYIYKLNKEIDKEVDFEGMQAGTKDDLLLKRKIKRGLK